MLDDRTDALFPLPTSAPGKLLKHLVVRQIPGTPIEARTADVARGAGLRAAEATAALSKLSDDGLVLLEPGIAEDAFTVTVLLAPPLDEYGITPQWAEAGTPGTPVTAIPPAVPPSKDGRAPSRAPKGSAISTPMSNQERTTPSVPPASPPAQAPAATPPPADGHRRGTFPTRASATARPLPLPDAPAATTTLEPSPKAAPPRAATRTKGAPAARRTADTSASVDETALVRGFVERFERMLAEIDDWKKRAQDAEARATAAEKKVQAAEKRADTADTRLAEAQERLTTWADLTRRMQQLSRQADGGTRGRSTSTRGSRPRGGRIVSSGGQTESA